MRLRFVQPSQLDQGQAEIVFGHGIAGFELQRSIEMFDGFVRPLLLQQDAADVVMGECDVGVDVDRVLQESGVVGPVPALVEREDSEHDEDR